MNSMDRWAWSAGLALLVATLTSLAPAQTSSTGLWSPATALPIVITEVGATALEGKIHVLGGSVDGRMTNAFHGEYDTKTNLWRWRAPLPMELSHVGVTAMNGRIYAIGGLSDPAKVHTGSVDNAFEYDPKSDTWRALPPMKAPRASVGVAVVDGELHAIGGRALDQSTLALHQAWNPKTNVWTDRAPLPKARDHMATVAVDGKIHVIGGRFAGAAENTGMHDVYDPKTDSWSAEAPMPTPRSGVSSGFAKGKIVVAGGECRNRATYNEVEAYDVAAKTWSVLTPLPSGRHAFGGASIGDRIFFAGGSRGCGGNDKTNDLLVLSLP
jgi:Kelch motif/Galactose oxidase, central domain